MKIHFLPIAIALLALLSGCNTTSSLTSADTSYTSIIEVPGKSKSELFTATNVWFADNFVSSKSVIQYSDKEAGKVVGKYHSQVAVGLAYHETNQTVQVDVKDGKVRLTFRNPQDYYSGSVLGGNTYGSMSMSPTTVPAVMDAMRKSWMELEQSLRAHLTSTSSQW